MGKSGPIALLRLALAHPITRGLDLDDPRTTERRARIIQEKAFLRHVYGAWYQQLAQALPDESGPVLELGSGGGFLARYIPQLITSDLFPAPGVSVVLDGTRLPFRDGSLRAIVMTNVLHHIAHPADYFREAARVVRPGGRLLMLEPWLTSWSRFVFRYLHHEPMDEASPWELTGHGALSDANSALPWIIFSRDADRFRGDFPEWGITAVRPCFPFIYLLSGGVALRLGAPGLSFPVFRAVERVLDPAKQHLSMFAQIELTRLP